MRGKNHVCPVSEHVDRSVQRLPPVRCIPNLGSAQGQQVVKSVGCVLSSTERLELREVKQHLRWSFGTRRHLKNDLNAVDGLGLPGCRDYVSRRDKCDGPNGSGLTQAAIDLTVGRVNTIACCPRFALRLSITWDRCSGRPPRLASKRRTRTGGTRLIEERQTTSSILRSPSDATCATPRRCEQSLRHPNAADSIPALA